jgi:hypothetical protein
MVSIGTSSDVSDKGLMTVQDLGMRLKMATDKRNHEIPDDT